MPRNNNYYHGNLIPFAKALRKGMTREEKHLWYDFLRDYPVKIYRQRTISGYIADFYCASAKLVIELDGGQHFEPEALAYDAGRTCVFENQGIQVIRFTNEQINNEFENVCDEINRVITMRKNNGSY